jgi:trimethylamine--corrinoid protein Co-methyltransferase
MAKYGIKAGFGSMASSGLKLLSNDELDTLHYATLQVLKNTGVRVESRLAADLFQSGGASVKNSDGYALVKIPAHLVEDSIQSAPSTITFYGRTPEDDFVAEPNRFSFQNVGVVPSVIDLKSGEMRPFAKQDSADVARLCDALDEVMVYERAGLPTDCPAESIQLHNWEAMLANTSKHILGCAGSVEKFNCIVQMAGECCGGMDIFNERPCMTMNLTVSSPLFIVASCSDIAMAAARQGVNVVGISMTVAGGTSPVTLAGTLVQSNAEILSLLVLNQLANKGAPYTYSQTSIMMDLKTGLGALGAPETGLINAASAQLAQYYRLPCWVGGAGYNDSKTVDAQAILEGTMNALFTGLAGANLIMGGGSINSILTFDYAKMVIDHEMFRYIRKMIEGVRITEETLALDVIDQVGPGGNYLAHDHTFNHMRKRSPAGLFCRTGYEQWVGAGKQGMYERAREKATELLSNHEPKALPAGAADRMRDIVAGYEKEKGIDT